MAILKEGDLVLLKGSRVISNAISLFSDNFSHCAIVLKINDQLCFCHSTPNPAKVPSVFGIVHSGVIATSVNDSISSRFYVKSEVYRFKDMNSTKIKNMKKVLAKYYGEPYEKNYCALICSAFKCLTIDTPSFSCSEFCAQLLKSAELFDDSIHGTLPNEFHINADFIGILELPAFSYKWFCSIYNSPTLSYEEIDKIKNLL